MPPTEGCRLPSTATGSSGFPLAHDLDAGDPLPSLRGHYPTSSLLQRSPSQCSASVLLPHGVHRLCFSLHIGATGSRSSAQKPVPDSCPLYAGRRPSSHQAPDGLIPEVWTASGFDDTYGYRRVFEGLLSLSFRTPTCPESYPGLFFRRSPPRLFTAAARTGLRPAPESRSRWAYHHLLRSFTSRFSSP